MRFGTLLCTVFLVTCSSLLQVRWKKLLVVCGLFVEVRVSNMAQLVWRLTGTVTVEML